MARQKKSEWVDQFNVSKGNLEVLKVIPEMMEITVWRYQLRLLVKEYKQSHILQEEKK